MSDVIQLPESRLSRAVALSGQLAEALTSSDAGASEASVGGRNEGAITSLPAALAPLHELEPSLMSLIDTAELVTEEQELAFMEELSATLQSTVAKRDRVGAFIKHCEARKEECAEEIERLQARKKGFANAAERVRDYVLWIIEGLGPDEKGKSRKLEGDKFTFSTRKAKDKLDIYDETLVPNQYKSVSIELRADVYFRYAGVLRELLGIETASNYSVDEALLRKDLEAPSVECDYCIADIDKEACPKCGGSGIVPPSIPGARLITERKVLVLK
jgi:Siphovirus Gp157